MLLIASLKCVKTMNMADTAFIRLLLHQIDYKTYFLLKIDYDVSGIRRQCSVLPELLHAAHFALSRLEAVER